MFRVCRLLVLCFKGFSTLTEAAQGTFDSIDAGLKEGAATVDEKEAANRHQMRDRPEISMDFHRFSSVSIDLDRFHRFSMTITVSSMTLQLWHGQEEAGSDLVLLSGPQRPLKKRS